MSGIVAYPSTSGEARYRVTIALDGRGCSARCSCPDYVVRGVMCKHIAFVAMFQMAEVARARSKREAVSLALEDREPG